MALLMYLIASASRYLVMSPFVSLHIPWMNISNFTGLSRIVMSFDASTSCTRSLTLVNTSMELKYWPTESMVLRISSYSSFVIRYTSINCFIAMQAMHKPITRKSSPICACHRFLQILMPTYINAIPIAMNIIDNAVNIYYTSISELIFNP